MDPEVKYLLSLKAIRERAAIVGKAAKAGQLSHFEVHEDKLEDVADFVTSVIKRDFGPDRFDTIPPHGRWQHFEVSNVPRVSNLLDQWKKDGCDDVELTRRLIDLFFVSVLLDAGAGDYWRYKDSETGHTYERSEGIAIASLHMFKALSFTADQSGGIPKVDGRGLEALSTQNLSADFQVSDKNPMLGVDSRAGLLRSLGSSLLRHPDIFGPEGRPGNIVDHMLSTAQDSTIDVLTFWDILQSLLIPCWPQDRTTISGFPLGDAWPLSTLSRSTTTTSNPASSIQPFHKLTQWLTYSLMVPFTRILHLTWLNSTSLTALPEYRNGGLFVDLGALTLKPTALDRGIQASGQHLPEFDAGDDVIVEWRAMTVVLLDIIYEKVLERMGGAKLSIAQMLEAGTWKAGREIAAKKRPETKSSPILIKSDGTVF